MNVSQFIAKWQKVELKERSAAQERFLDLCRVVEHPTPAEADPAGEWFCFEKGASKEGGGEGFAGVWKKDYFGWPPKRFSLPRQLNRGLLGWVTFELSLPAFRGHFYFITISLLDKKNE